MILFHCWRSLTENRFPYAGDKRRDGDALGSASNVSYANHDAVDTAWLLPTPLRRGLVFGVRLWVLVV